MFIQPNIDDVAARAWEQLLLDQHGVVHRSDIPPEVWRLAKRELHARRWQRIKRDVFATHNGPLTVSQQEWAALKSAPHGSALSGLTAAHLGGLSGFPSSAIYVTQPCGTHKLQLSGVVVHFSRFLDTRDVHPLQIPRRTRPARSLLDAASFTEGDHRARSILLAGVQQGITSVGKLREALPRRGPCLHHALICETLDDTEGGIRSVPEGDFDVIRRRYRLPPPARQRAVQRRNGRYYLDADWEEYALSVEVDGIPHLDIVNWDADLDRANEIAIHGRTLLRFTSFAVRHRPDAVGTVLIRALLSRGWQC
jgi:hypothetical protein